MNANIITGNRIYCGVPAVSEAVNKDVSTMGRQISQLFIAGGILIYHHFVIVEYRFFLY